MTIPAGRVGLVLVLAVLATAAAAGPTGAGSPTVEQAAEFIRVAEERFLRAVVDAEQAAWVQQNFITHDTEILAGRAEQQLIATTVELAQQATRFDGLELPRDLARKLKLLKLALTKPAPDDPELQSELTRVSTSMQSRYGKGKFCRGADGASDCLSLTDLTRILAESRDPAELERIWTGWRQIARPMREEYRRFVELANAGARGLGFPDLGTLWRSKYDMPPEQFAAEVDRLWNQVRPLYEALHCHVRAKLAERYGTDVVPPRGPIPAHLLGNMWAQQWTNVYELVAP